MSSIDTSGFTKAVRGLQKETDAATRGELVAAGRMLLAAAKANASGPPRDKEGQRVQVGATRSGRARFAVGGGARLGGPGVRSGRLRAGIRMRGPRKRGNVYTLSVGASRDTPYARAMELGNRRWKDKAKYPFLTTAYRTVRPQFAKRIRTTWSAAVTGSRARQTLD